MQVTSIRLASPCCQAKVFPAALMRYATIQVRRTCPRCHKVWRVLLRPLKANEKMVMTEATWTAN